MRLLTFGDRVKKNFKNPLRIVFKKKSVTKKSKNIDDQKMRDVAELLEAQMPGCGFAVFAFDIEDNETCANYVSNIQDDFMINALEVQINLMKSKRAALASLYKAGS